MRVELVHPEPSIFLGEIEGKYGQINGFQLDLETAYDLYDKLRGALIEAGEIMPWASREPEPRCGVVIEGLGRAYPTITNWSEEDVRFYLWSGDDADVPKQYILERGEKLLVYGPDIKNLSIEKRT